MFEFEQSENIFQTLNFQYLKDVINDSHYS